MTPFEKMQVAVGVVAIGCALLSFLVYLVLSLRRPAAEAAAKSAHDTADLVRARAAAVTPAEVTELVKALASLGESLAKAGPALWSMIGSVLFLLIAAIAAGVLQAKPAAPQAPGGGGAANPPAAVGAAAPGGGAPQAPAHENLKVKRN